MTLVRRRTKTIANQFMKPKLWELTDDGCDEG
jgi:hypothetical protein